MKLTQLAEALMQTGLTIVAFRMLLTLSKGEHEKQVDICQDIGTTRTTVCSTAFKLQEHGLVTLVRIPEDRRQVRVQITEEGINLLKGVVRTLHEIENAPAEEES